MVTHGQNTRITGLVPAVFTPFHKDGSLNLDNIGAIVEQLIQEKVGGLYVCGSTGEGASLTAAERKATAEAYIAAAAGRIPVIVQVGHDSLVEARGLAAHAQQAGANAISAVPPIYVKPASVEVLVQCLVEVAGGAPDIPFYYYHIPPTTGVHVDVVHLLQLGSQHIPNLAGAKFSIPMVHELQACLNLEEGRFDMLFGVDEMLLSGLSVGVKGAVGTTFNFAAPLFRRIIDAFNDGDLAAARLHQGYAVEMIRTMFANGGRASFKATMALIGLDCGPPRLPIVALTAAETAVLEKKLAGIGFFEWGR